MSLGELSLIISVVGVVPYIWQIIRADVRPERMTWFIWTIILALATWGYHALGSHDSTWFLVGDLLATAAIFFLSLWRGIGGYQKLDLVCFGIALAGLLIWQLSNTPLFIIFGALLADGIALVPTLVKTLHNPMSESATTFAATTIAAILGILAVGKWDLILIFYPFYLFLANFITVMVILVSQYQVRRLEGVHASVSID